MADFVIVLAFGFVPLAVLVGVIRFARKSRGDDGEDHPDDGGGGRVRAPRRPPPPSEGEPAWWPEFEHELEAYTTAAPGPVRTLRRADLRDGGVPVRSPEGAMSPSPSVTHDRRSWLPQSAISPA